MNDQKNINQDELLDIFSTIAENLQNQNINNLKLLRRTAVTELTSLPPATITDLVRNGEFPPPRKLSARCTAWSTKDVVEWINTRPVKEVSTIA